MHRIVFYSESSVVGGHEKMAIGAHRAMIRHGCDLQIDWIISASNCRLAEELAKASISFTSIDCSYPVDVRHLSWGAMRHVLSVARIFRESASDLIVVLQGGIVSSYGGVLAARLARRNFCSYIPMAPRSTELGTYRFPQLWNTLRSIYFRLIPKYITIDDTQAWRIRRENPKASIAVVENFVPPPSKDGLARSLARAHLNLPNDQAVIGVIGRIDFPQKAQDWLIATLGGDSFLRDKILLIVGDGPDAGRLMELQSQAAYRGQVRVARWQENLDEVYSAIDVLLISSKAEGVPLVMLEALARRIPVVGTDRDGMQTWLPREWRFPFGHQDLMKKCLDHALLGGGTDWTAIEAHLAQVTDERRFALEFAAALSSHCRSGG